ncbi:MAG: hypothetical protein WAK95_14045 [Desulfobacterales bacterium]
MEKRISATRAVREFSELLNTIKFNGTRYIIEREGKPIASMGSVDEKINPMTLGNLKSLLKKLPKLEEERDAFASDLEEISKKQLVVPAGNLWELSSIQAFLSRPE